MVCKNCRYELDEFEDKLIQINQEKKELKIEEVFNLIDEHFYRGGIENGR